MKSLTILPAKNCRRSQKILKYLEVNQIPFKRVELDSTEGEMLMKKYQFLASPGILLDGRSINPYDFLVRSECRIDEGKLKEMLDMNGEQDDD